MNEDRPFATVDLTATGPAGDAATPSMNEPASEGARPGVGALPRPVPIGEQEWPEGTVPLVSICCITYNHGPFIRQCLDGFLMQETTFPVEILIHDDASTDDTAEVIREFASRHPRTLKPILQTKNQYSSGIKPNVTFNLPRAKGSYIAICEGDDYWTDPRKLMQQVDVLNAHPEYVGCFHDVLVVYEDRTKASHLMIGSGGKSIVTLEDLLLRNFIPTLSVMYRSGVHAQLPEWYFQMPFGDWPMHILNAQRGSFLYLPEVMATYRVHEGGVWSAINGIERLRKTIKILDGVNRHFDLKYRKIINREIARCHFKIAIAVGRQGRDREVLSHLASSLDGLGTSVPLGRFLKLAYRHGCPWLHKRTHWRIERLQTKLRYPRKR